tara:strand:- start:521 stop:691 length:171 start_codon:yes stop_codon:yes gene_type:complete
MHIRKRLGYNPVPNKPKPKPKPKPKIEKPKAPILKPKKPPENSCCMPIFFLDGNGK